MQQRARQERLNNSRKWKGEGCAEIVTLKEKDSENCKPDNLDVLTSDTHAEGTSDIIGLDDDDDDEKSVLSGEADGENLLVSVEGDKIGSKGGSYVESCSCDPGSISKGEEDEYCLHDESLACTSEEGGRRDEGSSSEISKITCKSKRHSDRDLDNPKPCKCRRPTEDSSNLSRKYSDLSFCSSEDQLPDGFYDAGRDRPFMPLSSYEQILHLDSREVILLDRSFYT